MAPETWLWGLVSGLLFLLVGHQHQRTTRNEDAIGQLRVHIAEKYTPTEDLAALTAALNEVRKELIEFRREFHNAQLSWAGMFGGKPRG